MFDTQIIVYKKSDLDKIVDLLDSLIFQGNIVRNSQVITAIVQILQTQGTVQNITNQNATQGITNEVHEDGGQSSDDAD